ncbi:MAG: nucleoside monophosphate kinase [Candidatus Pacebacteria bacterium]|nr:nucleoside monophosphate kinase [Candidatus Paceibacterota bacterium]MDD3047846.1 nucleoside monophosphate kinase [Candidatus Paceibacterota bacterium]MDD3509903.1 nucleoside monophosphate kinase [Candidatus Paceibacterota bacterium]MDD4664353.1 nucleoside monophosphate kinase [Candidatus Paceibacterota bacterium]
MDKKPVVVCVLGKAGSGKGTQVNLLKERLNLNYIGSGELLRNRKLKNDFTGEKIASVIDKGGLVLTPVIFALWMQELEKLKNLENLNGILIDGSPRKILEARLIEEAMLWYDWKDNFKVILIDIPDEEVFKRLLKRAEIEGREDDTKEGIIERLKWYEIEVVPVIEFFKEKGLLIEINGNQEVEAVYNEIIEKLNL